MLLATACELAGIAMITYCKAYLVILTGGEGITKARPEELYPGGRIPGRSKLPGNYIY